jgi:putative transposase
MTTTRKPSPTTMGELCEVLISNGLPGLKEVLEKMLNMAMQLERQEAIGAEPYERTEDRCGYANGFKGRSVQTRLGEIPVKIPQVRGFSFYPQSLERGVRSERALKLAIAEMYLQGVSTRKVEAITEKLCGFSISSSQVSRLTSELDGQLHQWRERLLGKYSYVFLDARYEKVRHEGCVQDLAVLWAIGINEKGDREVLGVSVSLSEAEVHWRSFLEQLQHRGLCGVQLLISDDHAGLKAARKSVFPSIPWQRCQFHLSQNVQSYVLKQDWKTEVAQDVRDIFAASTLEQAEEQLRLTVTKYEKRAPKLAHWLETDLPEGFTVYRFPRKHHRRIRTTNLMERINREIRRRTRVATLFPNEASCLRLVSALLMETHEEWVTSKCYLNMDYLNRHSMDKHDHSFYRKKVA